MQKNMNNISVDPDAPELSSETLAQAVRIAQLPGNSLLEKLRNFQTRRNKVPVSIRLDPEIVDYYRETGRGWQTRINNALRACMQVEQAAARE